MMMMVMDSSSSSETSYQEITVKKLVGCGSLMRHVSQIITTTLLSLLLPLAFLLLSRLVTAHYLLYVDAYNTTATEADTISLVSYLFLYTDGSLHYILVAFITASTLVHVLTGKLMPQFSTPIGPVSRPRLYAAWIFLCVFQVCVCMGIEGSIDAGVDASGFGEEKWLMSRVIFFLGLHETMLYWSKTVVKPVVDDTLFGFGREERWVEKVVMALSFGTLWWWRLRDEIESLVVVVKMKRELLMGVGVVDFAGWWLYYLTVIIGVVRVVKGLLSVGVILLCRGRRRVVETQPTTAHLIHNDDKV